MTGHGQLLEAIDETRRRGGFLSLAETLALAKRGNVVLDPFSTLISLRAVIGERNVFHPNVRVECHDAAVLRIGSGNVFHCNTVVEAAMNSIAIGDDNLFGEGIHLSQGQVIDGWGRFRPEDAVAQSTFHPPKAGPTA